MSQHNQVTHNNLEEIGEHGLKILSNFIFWALGGAIYILFFKLHWWDDSTKVMDSINAFLISVLDINVFAVLLVWSVLVMAIYWLLKLERLFMETLSELVRFFYIAGPFILVVTLSYNRVHDKVIVSNGKAFVAFLMLIGFGYIIYFFGKKAFIRDLIFPFFLGWFLFFLRLNLDNGMFF
ncbi:hypothetical protein [Dyella acidiphila]|uniref:Uncharacterized protein n=1 Tax=Dyella acidiphila TaxID=2775866 RepID=A0ABR9GAM1_9GAMM|nr:hypothetical protein [Dyella acidiphila]MBE1161111.1 hypothetical protein [Dyella acidiphila]